MISLDKLMQGTIDMHIHTAPDTIPMRLDALEAARMANKTRMKAIVLKSHYYTTAPLASMVGQIVPDVHVFGAISLDYEVGGLNHHALKIAAELGAKVVWMATHSAANSKGEINKDLDTALVDEGYSILNSRGELVSEIDGILPIVKKHDMVLSSGHISPAEIFALFDKARDSGIQKLVVTHASNTEIVKESVSLDDQKKLANMGAYIEHTAAEVIPADFGRDPKEIADAIRYVGAENCILSSDLGMVYSLYPAEGLRVFISSLMRFKVSPEEIELMTKRNPARLLGIESI